MRAIALAVAAAVLFLHLCAVVALLDRPLHYDENEYLHAGWLMAAGKRIYTDFFEDHPPHLFLLLRAVMPGGDPHDVDVLDWTRRARLLSALFGTGVVALVMLFVWRATRDPAAPVIAAAVLLSSPQFWSRGLCDVRAEAPTLALFWAGLVLLTWSEEPTRAQAIRAGTGIGLMFFAIVWNPKWPLEAAVAGGYFLWFAWRLLRTRWQRFLAAVAPAMGVAALAIAPIFATTTFSDYLFFNYTLKAASVDSFAQAQWVKDAFARAPVWESTSVQFRWWWVVAAIAVVTALCVRMARAGRRLAIVAVILSLCALVEFRFIYPYPYLWAQYLVMIATSSAVLYALIPALVKITRKSVVIPLAALMAVGVTAVAGPPLARLATGSLSWWLCIAALLMAWLPVVLSIKIPSLSLSAACATGAIAILSLGQLFTVGLRPNDAWKFYWTRQAEMQAATGPTRTVFISPARHPVAAFDASYYWYSFKEAAPFAIRYAAAHPSPLPNIAVSDLPPCTIASNVRFVEVAPWTFHLDGACRCVEQAFRQLQLKPTDSYAIFETHADPASSLTPRARAWAVRTANVWRDYCSYRDTLADELHFDALAARK